MNHSTDRGIVASVYKHRGRSFAGGDGVSDLNEEVWVPVPRGHITRAEAQKIDIPQVELVKRESWMLNIFVPTEDSRPTDAAERVGPMFGGTFVSCTDSRFSDAYGYRPIALHDRWDTQETYDRLTR